jgi:hypothetical protein
MGGLALAWESMLFLSRYYFIDSKNQDLLSKALCYFRAAKLIRLRIMLTLGKI